MKTIKQIAVGIILLVSGLIKAQPMINVNVSENYNNFEPTVYSDVDYYYLPEIDSYYNVRTANYFFIENGNWTCSINLPRPYCDFDLNRCRKIALNRYRGNRPYEYFNYHNKIGCGKERRNEESLYYRQNPPRFSYNHGYRENRGYTYNSPRAYERERSLYPNRNNNCQRENRRDNDRRR